MMSVKEVALITNVPGQVQGFHSEAHDGSGSPDR
jgi:hypothetical protein